MSKWRLRWPWYQRSITLRNVAVLWPRRTDDEVPATTYAATASPAATYAATAASPMVEYVDPAPFVTYAAPAPVIEYIAPAPAMTYVASRSAVTSCLHRPQLTLLMTTSTFPRLMSLILFLPWKSLLSPCTTKSIRNRLLQVRRLRTLRKSLLCTSR